MWYHAIIECLGGSGSRNRSYEEQVWSCPKVFVRRWISMGKSVHQHVLPGMQAGAADLFGQLIGSSTGGTR